MTDCYICGHPILEGQRKGSYSEVIGRTLVGAETRSHPVHLNVQDCLPTLPNDELDDAYWQVRAAERERAARIVEGMTPSGIWGNGFDEAMHALAQRIREGDPQERPES